eukprot:ctg_1576.g503
MAIGNFALEAARATRNSLGVVCGVCTEKCTRVYIAGWWTVEPSRSRGILLELRESSLSALFSLRRTTERPSSLTNSEEAGLTTGLAGSGTTSTVSSVSSPSSSFFSRNGAFSTRFPSFGSTGVTGRVAPVCGTSHPSGTGHSGRLRRARAVRRPGCRVGPLGRRFPSNDRPSHSERDHRFRSQLHAV